MSIWSLKDELKKRNSVKISEDILVSDSESDRIQVEGVEESSHESESFQKVDVWDINSSFSSNEAERMNQ